MESNYNPYILINLAKVWIAEVHH